MIPDTLIPARYSDGYGGHEWFATVNCDTTPRRQMESECWTDFIRALRETDAACVRITGETLEDCRVQIADLLSASDAAGLMAHQTQAGPARFGGHQITTRLVRLKEDAA